MACKNFTMEVISDIWYKELEDPDTFYMNVTTLKLLNHLIEFCSGLHTVDAVDIPQLMKALFTNADGIPQFINAMEAAQQKPKQAKRSIQDEYMHTVALKLLLQSAEYETKTREWSKLPDKQQTCMAWKTTFRKAYVAKQCAEAAIKGEGKPFRGSAVISG